MIPTPLVLATRPALAALRPLALVLTLTLVGSTQASAVLQPTAEGFAGGPDAVGVTLSAGPAGVVVTLVPAGHGTLPDALTGFAGPVPSDALGRTDARATLDLSDALVQRPGGVVLQHAGASVASLAQAYRDALLDLGMTMESDAATGSARVMEFSWRDDTIRLALAYADGDVEVYLGR